MESDFQTSFIPKKPIVQERTTPAYSVNILTLISLPILFFVVLGTAGMYFYKISLAKKITEMENTLVLARNRFELSRITELQILDKRLRAANEILSKHVATTPIFEALSAITMKTVRYTDFSYTFEDASQNQTEFGLEDPGPSGPRINVKMSGLAVGYRSVALQSDLFNTKEEGKNFFNPVFSNLRLDDSGHVLFDLEFSVDLSFINYKNTLTVSS